MNPNSSHDIKNDHDLDRVLTALGNIQPPAHLEHRILAALEAHPVPAPRWAFWTMLPPARHGLTLSLAFSGVGLVVAIFSLSAHNSARPAHHADGPSVRAFAKSRGPQQAFSARWGGTWGIAPRATALPRSASNSVGSDDDHAVSSAVEQSRSSPHRPSLQTLSHHDLQSPTQPQPGPHTLLCDCDPTAVAEASAPSLPAPPLPLTAQEKLLLRIAHHPNPVELAELDPHQREAAIAEERAAYKNFFHPPTPPAPPTPPDPSAQPDSSAQPNPQLQPESATPSQPSPTAPNGDQP